MLFQCNVSALWAQAMVTAMHSLRDVPFHWCNCTRAGAVKGGAVSSEAAAIQQQLLQQAQRLSLDDESGITPVRLNQPTPANTPVGNAADAMGKAVSGPHHG